MGKISQTRNKRAAQTLSSTPSKRNVILQVNKKQGALSRGQRKRLAKKKNLVAKKAFVKFLTKIDTKDKKTKAFGKLQVDDVSKMFEEVAKQIENKNQSESISNKKDNNRVNNNSNIEVDNTKTNNNINKNSNTNTNNSFFGSNTKNIISNKSKKSRSIIREELNLFNAVNKHPGFQSLGGLNAIQQHLKNIARQHHNNS
jgi:hypothetical protein